MRLALALLLCAACAPVQRTEPMPEAPSLAFTRVSVVDVESGRVLPEQTVLIAGSRIQNVASSRSGRVPAGAQVVDARGKYLIPGMIDTHTHLFLPWNRNWPDTIAQFGWIDDEDGQPGNGRYVNRGVGFSTIPIRINCRPELTYFRLSGSSTQGSASVRPKP